MSGALNARLRGLPRGLVEAGRALVDVVTRKPSRPHQALAWVREHAKAGDPASVLAALDDFARHHRFLMNVGDEKGPLLVATLRGAIQGRAAAGPRARLLLRVLGHSHG